MTMALCRRMNVWLRVGSHMCAGVMLRSLFHLRSHVNSTARLPSNGRSHVATTQLCPDDRLLIDLWSVCETATSEAGLSERGDVRQTSGT